MTTLPGETPVRYQPLLEAAEEDEAQTSAALAETLLKISETVHRDEGHAYRSVHAKSHGLLRAELQVLRGLAPELAQGLFAEARSYPVVMRFSTVPGDLLDDNVSTPRGLALKVIDVQGVRGPGSEADTTQDFVMVNSPTFGVPTAKKFLKQLKLLAATTDKAPGLKKALSTALQGLEALVEKAGGDSPGLRALGGQRETQVLGDSFFSQVPMLHGPFMAKVSVVPVSPALQALAGAPVDLKGRPDGLREAVVEHFRSQGGEWELRVQLCTDLQAMPIEDASVDWPQSRSPYVAVARIVAAPQPAWSEARSAAVDDGMAFNPWHCLAAHRPIGSIMRVRRAAYEMSARFRAQHNATPLGEPHSLDALPD
jgi:hypothetical protein